MKDSSSKRPYEIPEFLLNYGVPTIVKALLDTDPLVEAEKITGESYKTSKVTTAIGFLKMQELHRDKDSILGSNKDTVYSMKTEEWEVTIKAMGFDEILEIPFNSEGYEDKFVCCWLNPGVLLCYDTFHGHRNAASIYYCWKPDEDVKDRAWEFQSTGCWTEKGILVGSHDAREALRFNLYRLFTHGTFIAPWPKQPFLWFLHYGDTKIEGYDYKAINAERIAMLPEKVVKVISASQNNAD